MVECCGGEWWRLSTNRRETVNHYSTSSTVTGTYVFVHKPECSLRANRHSEKCTPSCQSFDIHTHLYLWRITTLDAFRYSPFLSLQVMHLRSFTEAVFVAYRVINPPISDGVCPEYIFYTEENVCCPHLKFTSVNIEKLHWKHLEQLILLVLTRGKKQINQKQMGK